MKRRKMIFFIGVFAMLSTVTLITTSCESTDAINVLQGITDGINGYLEDSPY